MTARFARAVVVFVLLAVAGEPSTALAGHDTTISDIIRMSQADLSNETILAFLRHEQVPVQLTAENLVAMVEAGVSEDLIIALIEYEASSVPEDPSPDPGYRAYARYPSGFYTSYYYYRGHGRHTLTHHGNVSRNHAGRSHRIGHAVGHRTTRHSVGRSTGRHSVRHRSVGHSSGHRSVGHSSGHRRGGHSGGHGHH